MMVSPRRKKQCLFPMDTRRPPRVLDFPRFKNIPCLCCRGWAGKVFGSDCLAQHRGIQTKHMGREREEKPADLLVACASFFGPKLLEGRSFRLNETGGLWSPG